MTASLETMVAGKRQNRFKSKGEEKIAKYLDLTKIRYRYEPAVIIESQDKKQRIWYPDFYLPEFKTYIEYYGLAGNQKYDQGIRAKTQAYQKSGFDVIPFYPWVFAKDWHGYLKRALKRSIDRGYQNYSAKPFRHITKKTYRRRH